MATCVLQNILNVLTEFVAKHVFVLLIGANSQMFLPIKVFFSLQGMEKMKGET